MEPPPAAGSFVGYGCPFETGHWLYVHECDHICGEMPSHSAPKVGWITSSTSTKPSSSPEFGTPSGPSLSNAPKSADGSRASRISFIMSPVFEGPGTSPLVYPPRVIDFVLRESCTQSNTVPVTSRRPYETSLQYWRNVPGVQGPVKNSVSNAFFVKGATEISLVEAEHDRNRELSAKRLVRVPQNVFPRENAEAGTARLPAPGSRGARARRA